VSLSGWTLTRLSGEIETTHKFHRQMKLEPNAIVTIWSSDALAAVHEPPTNLVMKGQKWFPGEEIKTALKNNSGEVKIYLFNFLFCVLILIYLKQEMATRTTKLSQASRQRVRFADRLGFGTPEDLFHQEGDGPQGERCVIC
jgi:lamin B